MKRTQTSTEYMVILSVVVIVGLITVNTMSSVTLIGGGSEDKAEDAGLQTGEVGIMDSALGSTGSQKIIIRNNQAEDINILNISIKNSSGEYTLFSDDDKLLLSGKKKTLVNTSSVDLCSESGERFDTKIIVWYSKVGAEYSFEAEVSGECAESIETPESVSGSSNTAPGPITLNNPSDGETYVYQPATLNVTVNDGDGDEMDVDFYGGEKWSLFLGEMENDIPAQDGSSRGIFFKSDGTKMFEIGVENDMIYESDLAEPWNISTANYAGKNISTHKGNASGIFFKSDGTMMFETDYDSAEIYAYTLEDPWNITNASYEMNITARDDDPADVFINDNGDKMYEVGLSSARIYEYDLSDPWNLSTASYNSNITTEDASPSSLFFKGDGTKMYELGTDADVIYEYNLSSPWALSSANYTGVSRNTPAVGIYFRPDGSMLYEILSDHIGWLSLHKFFGSQSSVQDGSDATIEVDGLGTENEVNWFVEVTDGQDTVNSSKWVFTTAPPQM
ncbi:MAG: hypothetical protein ACQEP1_03380 [Nanobdellota archaeon]